MFDYEEYSGGIFMDNYTHSICGCDEAATPTLSSKKIRSYAVAPSRSYVFGAQKHR